MPRKGAADAKMAEQQTESSDIQNLITMLATGMAEMQLRVSELAGSVKVSQSNIQEILSQSRTATVNATSDKKHYITLFKDLGGTNLFFNPSGSVHPMLFLKKLKKLFDEAGVPEAAQVSLAVNCLKGSAADWIAAKEHTIKNYVEFERAFKSRYWGGDAERDLYREIRYGAYKNGSRADYMLKLAGKATFLSERIEEEDLVEMLSKHFEKEIQRAVYLNGIKTLEDFDEYLRKLDETYESVGDSSRVGENNWRAAGRAVESGRGQGRNVNWQPRRNQETVPREPLPADNGVRGQTDSRTANTSSGRDSSNVNLITRYYAEAEFLVSDQESEANVDEKLFSPVVKATVCEKNINVLVDSGSQVSAVSEEFIGGLQGQGIDIPILPVSNTSIAVAVGRKRQKVKEQVLLEVNIDGKSYEVVCLVIPKLNREIVLGCDWLAKINAVLDFQNAVLKVMSGTSEVEEIKLCYEKFNDLEVNAMDEKEENIIRHRYSERELEAAAAGAEVLDESSKDNLSSLLKNFADVFSETPGRTRVYQHEIHMRDETPFLKNSYPIPFKYREEVRRQIREVGRLLRAFCFKKHTAWATRLKDVEHCLNNVVHSTTGYTPLYLQSGTVEPNNISKIVGYPKENDQLAVPLEQSWELAHRRMMTKAERRKLKHEQSNPTICFKEGDAVLVRTHLLSSAEAAEIKKLFLLYEGPYFVSRVVGPNAYDVADSNGVVVGRQNIINLKPYRHLPRHEEL